MEIHDIKITRQELYNKVWAMPIIKLAEDYNLFDNGLRKICRKYDIPTPPKGYWVSRGFDRGSQIISMRGDPEQKISIRIRPREERQPYKDKSLKITPITVANKLTNPHPYISELKASISAEEDEYKCVHNPTRDTLAFNVRVTKAQLSRALRIFNTLIKELENLGGVILKKTSYYHFKGEKIDVVNFEDERFQFTIYESTKRMPLAPNEVAKKWPYHPYKFVSDGKLSLIIQGKSRGLTACKLNDHENKPLELRLNFVIFKLKEIAAKSKRNRQQAECEELKQKQALHEQELQEQNRNKEKEKEKLLLEQVSNWQKARLIREYTQHCVEQALLNQDKIKFLDELNEWARWSLSYADSIDPSLAFF